MDVSKYTCMFFRKINTGHFLEINCKIKLTTVLFFFYGIQNPLNVTILEMDNLIYFGKTHQ